jgi:hypothetical protein
MGAEIWNLPYWELNPLTKKPLLKASWKFFSSYEIHLRHDIQLPTLRVGDQPLMELFYNLNLLIDTFVRLNRCRLFSNIYYVSEVFTLSGREIKPSVLLPLVGPILNKFGWPRQGAPSQEDWDLWGAHVRGLLDKVTLVAWIPSGDDTWWYDPQERKLFQKQETGGLLSFAQLGRSTRSSYFQVVGTSNPINQIYPARVNKFKNYQVLHGWCKDTQNNQ